MGRPAVSQHLKLLKEAGLVVDQPVGTRRLYEINPDAMMELQRYARSFWSAAMTRYARARDPAAARAANPKPGSQSVVEARRGIDDRHARRGAVAGSPEDAFDLFTAGIGQWWPLKEGYSFGGDRAPEIVLEAAPGGRFYERFVDGDE